MVSSVSAVFDFCEWEELRLCVIRGGVVVALMGMGGGN